jgi:hypothetical protein
MIDRTKLLEVIRDNQTRLIQQARLKQLGPLVEKLNDISDKLDELASDDLEIDGKIDAFADEMEELNNELFGDDDK